MSRTAVLYRMETKDHICPYGLKSKDLLQRKGFDVQDQKLTTRDETDKFKREHGVETTPQTFINGERIGGYNALREHFGMDSKEKDENETSYQPVIAVFAMCFLMALAAMLWMANDIFSVRTIELFIAFSMCVLAILKLRDLYSFSNQFVTYDLLAQRVVRYAYVYPFAEAFAGLGMIANVLIVPVALTALFIGTIGGISVFKAVYIDKRELKCACVGGSSNVPLGFVSLTENLMMIGMGLWMLA
jgi:glutaredoxin